MIIYDKKPKYMHIYTYINASIRDGSYLSVDISDIYLIDVLLPCLTL